MVVMKMLEKKEKNQLLLAFTVAIVRCHDKGHHAYKSYHDENCPREKDRAEKDRIDYPYRDENAQEYQGCDTESLHRTFLSPF